MKNLRRGHELEAQFDFFLLGKGAESDKETDQSSTSPLQESAPDASIQAKQGVQEKCCDK